MNVELQVKECAKVGTPGSYPISVVVPLPYGAYQNVNSFCVTDESGVTVPAQFEVLNRNWMKDKSIANVVVNFQPTVSAFSSPGTGIAKYYFKDDGNGNATGTAFQVTNGSSLITVVTGPLKFTVSKTAFNIINELWLDNNSDGIFATAEQIISSNAQNGGYLVGRLPGDLQFDASRSDVSVTIEESGPMRVVIKAEALTKYNSTVDHTHGYAVRLYAYTGKPYVKVDYQLQNSAKNKITAWPLYFQSMDINFALTMGANPTVRVGLENGQIYQRSRDKGLVLAQDSVDRFKVRNLPTGDSLAGGVKTTGYIDISDGSIGVAAMTRYFWQMWPNGLSIDSTNKLQVQLWPNWSMQWFNCCGLPGFYKDIYWLWDMQHTYKEMMFVFHNGSMSSSELNTLAKTLEYPPVATVPTAWYYSTRSTLDYGGVLPSSQKLADVDTERKPTGYQMEGLNWFNGSSGTRRMAPAQAGGQPDGRGEFLVTENPKDYYFAAECALGELNYRPHSMAQYNYRNDYGFLRLGANVPHNRQLSYQSNLWRRQISGGQQLDTAYLASHGEGEIYSEQDARPRDQEHMWYYHMADAYFITGNPWLKDWFGFYGEYLKNTVSCSLAECGASSYRDQGHEGTNALNAYRIMGDTVGMNMMSYFWHHRYGDSFDRVTGVGYFKPWMVGFGLRGVCNYLEEIKGETKHWQSFVEVYKVLASQMEYNYYYGSFAYEGYPFKINPSYYGSLSLVDPFAWFYYNSGKKKYWNFLVEYMAHGINGGSGITVGQWKGSWGGRYVDFVRNNPKSDTIPPSTISDLRMTRNGSSCTLTWTAPTHAHRYMILWDSLYIVEEHSPDTLQMNWWAANVVGPTFLAVPGTEQSMTFTTSSGNLCASIYSFDTAYNLSMMSNKVLSDTTPPTVPVGFQVVSTSANKLEFSWAPSSDAQTGIMYYTVYRNNVRMGNFYTSGFVDSIVSAQTTYQYQVSATNKYFITSALSGSFSVTTLPDIEAPQLLQITAFGDSNKILLTFNERVDSAVMTQPSNYAISSGITVSSVQISMDRRSVTLNISSSPAGSTVDLTLIKVQDIASVPNIASSVLKSFEFITPLVITDAMINFTDDVTWDILENNKLIYTDRDAVIDSVGEKYRGLTCMHTIDGNFGKTAPAYISFTINRPCTVLVAHEDPCNTPPSWLSSSFTYTGDTIRGKWVGSGGFSNYRIYAKACTAGVVKLGGQNGSTNCATYWVIIKDRTSSIVSSVEKHSGSSILSDMFSVSPNPFNPSVRVVVRMSSRDGFGGKKWNPKLSVYDIRGALVSALEPENIYWNNVNQMTCSWRWDAKLSASGAYVVRVDAGNGKRLTRKVMLMR
jgi:hypothetical protein